MKKNKIKNGVRIDSIFYDNCLWKWMFGTALFGLAGVLFAIGKMIYCAFKKNIEFSTEDWIGFGAYVVIFATFMSTSVTLYLANVFMKNIDTINNIDNKSEDVP